MKMRSICFTTKPAVMDLERSRQLGLSPSKGRCQTIIVKVQELWSKGFEQCLLYLITLGNQTRRRPAILFTGKSSTRGWVSIARLGGVHLNSRFWLWHFDGSLYVSQYKYNRFWGAHCWNKYYGSWRHLHITQTFWWTFCDAVEWSHQLKAARHLRHGPPCSVFRYWSPSWSSQEVSLQK